MTREKPGPPRVAKRPFWRRWWFIVSVALVLALVGGYLLWDYTAEQALQAEIARIREAGEPINPEDLNAPPVPDEQNAAWPLRDAAAITVLSPREETIVGYARKTSEVVDAYRDEVAEAVAKNAEALALFADSRLRERVDWGVRWSSPVMEMPVLHLAPQKRLAEFVATASLYAHISGEDEIAIEHIRGLLAQGRFVQQDPMLISYLISLSIRAVGTGTAMRVAPDLRVGSGAGEASREAVEALIGELLEDRSGQALREAMQGERVYALDMYRCLKSGLLQVEDVFPQASTPQRIGLRLPFAERDIAGVLRKIGSYAEAAACDDYPSARSAMPRVQNSLEETTSWITQMRLLRSSGTLWGFDRAFTDHFNQIAEQRLVATALAMRLYELDHGHRPETLEELVPDYLDELPADPFTADGSPIKLGEWGGQPVLYSVGKDGIDDGGRWSEDPEQSRDFEEYDLVVFLNAYEPNSEAQLDYIRRELDPDSAQSPPAYRGPGRLRPPTAPARRPSRD